MLHITYLSTHRPTDVVNQSIEEYETRNCVIFVICMDVLLCSVLYI